LLEKKYNFNFATTSVMKSIDMKDNEHVLFYD